MKIFRNLRCGLTILRPDGSQYDSSKTITLTKTKVEELCPTSPTTTTSPPPATTPAPAPATTSGKVERLTEDSFSLIIEFPFIDAAPSCPDGWTAWGKGGCYKLFEMMKGGKEAEDYCTSEQVFTPTSYFVFTLLIQSSPWIIDV